MNFELISYIKWGKNMIFKLLDKCKILAVLIFFIGACFIPATGTISNEIIKSQSNDQNIINIGNEETEYWALLVAVGVYADDPQQNRPLMLEEIDDLYDVLLESPWWSEDHINMIKGEDATVMNIIKGLRWLDKMEDIDDISVVFITTHGSPLAFDIPPFDEDDGVDECLISYWGFAYPGAFIYDDEINFLLNRLESQGVCLIVDSCFAGGFNDPPDWNITQKDRYPSKLNKEMSSTEWIEGFAEDVRGQGRVVLMASCEDEVSYSGGFSPYLIDGLRGFADSNMDYIITAEETFFYTEPRTHRQHPTMYDGYEGELPLIDLTGRLNYGNILKDNQNIIEEEISESQMDTSITSNNSIVCGYVKDLNSSDPIDNASIRIRGRTDDWEFFENETISDLFGYYRMNIPSGRFRITASAYGYLSQESGVHTINENETRWVNFSLSPHPKEKSVIYGYIKDNKTGTPINKVNISLFWQGEQNQFYYNDTKSDINGFYSMNVATGEIELETEASGYFREHFEDIIIDDFETMWINFSLYSRPLENSIVSGFVKDKKTGSSINDARITFEWIDVNTGHEYQKDTHTDSSGFYSMNIAPGELYLDIRKQGYEFYNPYRHDSEENKTIWINVSLEEELIEVDIGKPLRALYLNNKRITPFVKTRIIGPIDIAAYVYEDWYGHGSAEKVEFYIDDVLKATVTSQPYNWTWNDKTFGKHTIKVVAYDNEGNSAMKELEVWKFL